MYTMRNRVSHGYDKVDLEIVWKTIQGDFPMNHTNHQVYRRTTGPT
ncbi:HepT-like ribonuclease domain-containing protein [Acidithiobacillus ferriphilus]